MQTFRERMVAVLKILNGHVGKCERFNWTLPVLTRFSILVGSTGLGRISCLVQIVILGYGAERREI